VSLERVSHDVVDDTRRRDQFTVERAWEDRTSESLRTFGQGSNFEASILLVFDSHSAFHE